MREAVMEVGVWSTLDHLVNALDEPPDLRKPRMPFHGPNSS
jgi:hypothetical protein